MGIFYTNITLYGPLQKQVVDCLLELKRTAYASPTVRNFTVVYDKETEDQDLAVIQQLTSLLTRKFACQALSTLVQDGDVFRYWLFSKGELVDEYDSTPGYFDPAQVGMLLPTGGDAWKLSNAFDAQHNVERVAHVLQLAANANRDDEMDTECLIGEDIHRELAHVLGVPLFAVATGYYTIENGFLADEFDPSEFIRCGSPR